MKHKIPSPHSLKKESWKVLQKQFLKENGLKKGTNPINDRFFKKMLLNYTQKGENEAEFLGMYEYMIRSTIYHPPYMNTNDEQKAEFRSTAYLHLFEYALKKYNPELDSKLFNYLLTVIQGACNNVITKDQDFIEKSEELVKSHVVRDPSIGTMNKQNVTKMMIELYDSTSRFNLDDKDVELYSARVDEFGEYIRSVFDQYKDSNDIYDIVVIPNISIHKFKSDIRFRRKRIDLQFGVYYINRDKVISLWQTLEEEVISDLFKDSIFTKYNNRTSIKSKKNALMHYEKLAVFEYFDMFTTNEHNIIKPTTLADHAIFSRIDGFDYYSFVDNNDTLDYRDNVSVYIHNLMSDDYIRLDKDVYDLATDLIPLSVFHIKNSTKSVKDWNVRYKVESNFTIFDDVSSKVILRNQKNNKNWIDLIYDNSQNIEYNRFYHHPKISLSKS